MATQPPIPSPLTPKGLSEDTLPTSHVVPSIRFCKFSIPITPGVILLSISALHALLYLVTYLFFIVKHKFSDPFTFLGAITGSFPFWLLIPLFRLSSKNKNKFHFVFNILLTAIWIGTASTCYYFAYIIFQCKHPLVGDQGAIGLLLVVPQIIASMILIVIIAISHVVSALFSANSGVVKISLLAVFAFLIISIVIIMSLRYLNFNHLSNASINATPIPATTRRTHGNLVVEMECQVKDLHNSTYFITWEGGGGYITIKDQNNASLMNIDLYRKDRIAYIDSTTISHNQMLDLIYIKSTGRGLLFRNYLIIMEYSLAKNQITHTYSSLN